MKFFSQFKIDKQFFFYVLHYFFIGILISFASFLGIKFNDLEHIVDVNFIAQELTNGISSFIFILGAFIIDHFFMFIFAFIHYLFCFVKHKFSSKSK